MTIRDQIHAHVKEGLKAKDKARVGVLRQVLAAIKQVEVDTREDVDEATTLAIFDKMIKQRKESIVQFDDAGRTDLSEKEKYEMGVIQGYMPVPLSPDEIALMIDAAIAEVGRDLDEGDGQGDGDPQAADRRQGRLRGGERDGQGAVGLIAWKGIATGFTVSVLLALGGLALGVQALRYKTPPEWMLYCAFAMLVIGVISGVVVGAFIILKGPPRSP